MRNSMNRFIDALIVLITKKLLMIKVLLDENFSITISCISQMSIDRKENKIKEKRYIINKYSI
jgi:hypothetical protein